MKELVYHAIGFWLFWLFVCAYKVAEIPENKYASGLWWTFIVIGAFVSLIVMWCGKKAGE